MKLKWIHIKNYRSCKDVRIELGPMHAIVGGNNAGKSSVLRALDFLFNPAKGKIDEEAFWNSQTEKSIWIEGFFDELTAEELGNEKLTPYLTPDNTFHISRSAKIVTDGEGGSSAEDKIVISQHFCKPVPAQDWLQLSKINGNNIDEWWGNQELLILGSGASFVDFVGGKNRKLENGRKKQRNLSSQTLKTSGL